MEREKNWLNRILITGFIVFSIVFLAFMNSEPHTLSPLVKTVPIACLALYVFLNMPGRRMLGVGLVFSGIGDILLELPVAGLFEAGMGAFILAHLCYISLFLRRPRLTLVRGLVMGAMVLFTLDFAARLYPALGPMKLPIFVYLGVILAMGVAACLGRYTNGIIISGAVFFIVSDALIAYPMFVEPIANSGFLVMFTYYAAQALLTYGTLKMKTTKSVLI